MKLGLMPGKPAAEMRQLGFDALQLFFKGKGPDDAGDMTDAEIDAALSPPQLDLAAMTVHLELVGAGGIVQQDVDRAVRLVGRTAALSGRFAHSDRPILIWHPSGYPQGEGVDDRAVFDTLCDALSAICAAAERQGVHLAVEISRACSVYSAESYLRLKDRVASPALRVCLDAANFTPDRTPLERAVRLLAPDVVIAHAKDVHFKDTGEVAGYGPVGSGKLDYAAYIRALKDYTPVPYLVLEYYKTTDQMLAARDIILQHL